MKNTLRAIAVLSPLLISIPALAAHPGSGGNDRRSHAEDRGYDYDRDRYDGDRGYNYDRDRHDDDRGDRHDESRSHAGALPSVVIRGPYANFFVGIGSDNRYVVRDSDRYRGYRVYDTRYEPYRGYYKIGHKRIDPTDCRRISFVVDKGRRDAIYSELVCRDRFGETSAVPHTRKFERIIRRR